MLFCATLQESAFSFACFFVHTNNNRDDHIICAYCSHDDDDVDDVKILFLSFFAKKFEILFLFFSLSFCSFETPPHHQKKKKKKKKKKTKKKRKTSNTSLNPP